MIGRRSIITACRAEGGHDEDDNDDDDIDDDVDIDDDDDDEKDIAREWEGRNMPSAYVCDGEKELCRNCRKDEEEARDGVKVQMVEISGNKAQVEEKKKGKPGPLRKE